MTGLKNIYVGTSGWSYKHWKNIFYPSYIKPSGYLTYLATEFNAAEINTSFYRLPKSETIVHWMRSVPAGFRFCPKMSRYLTQMKKLNDPEEPLARFFTLFTPFKKHLGPVLIQLPPNLGFHHGKTEYFFELLKEKYKTFKIALEPRHASWLEAPAIRLLKRFNIAWVIADSGGRFPMAEEVTEKDIYIRFHGPDGSYATSYTQDALKLYAEKCMKWSAKGHRLWLFFNNDIHGYAIENARTIKKILQIEYSL
jgi:uncharacterized protein YecE (DUF72 family)